MSSSPSFLFSQSTHTSSQELQKKQPDIFLGFSASMSFLSCKILNHDTW